MKLQCNVSIIIAVFATLVVTSYADAGLEITPSIAVREEYNDNIYLTRTDKKDDFITTITPAIVLSYKASILDLTLDYGLNFIFYAKETQENETSLKQAQRAKLQTSLSLVKDILMVNIFDEYQRIPIDQRNQVAFDNVIVNMTDSNRFYINPYFDYPLSSTLKARIGYTYGNTWYRTNGDNAENHSVAGSITKEISPKLNAFLDYSYSWHRYAITPAYENQSISLGVGWKLFPKLSFNGSVGKSYFYYGEERPEQSSIVWQLQANYQLTDSVSLNGGYSENFDDSVTQGTYKIKTATANVNYKGKIPTTIGIFKNEATYLTAGREDDSYGVTVGASLPLSSGITPNITGSYINYKFLPENINTDRYSARIGFDYALKITTIGVGYTFNMNDSSVVNNNYINNILFVQAKFTY